MARRTETGPVIPSGAARNARPPRIGLAACLGVAALLACSLAPAQQLDKMSLQRWEKLREVERYQLNIAEKIYEKSDYKAAADEYVKYLTLYEDSGAASYAQLKWSFCQFHQRHVNTAIKDGFQSVIDYWPDSPDAVAAAFWIGRAYKATGDTKKAASAYADVIERHPEHLVATLSRVDLIDIARTRGDQKLVLKLLGELTFETKRVGGAQNHCANASRELAQHYFNEAAFDKGVEALATTYEGPSLATWVDRYAGSAIGHLSGNEETRLQGHKLADQTIAYFKKEMPTDLSDEEQESVARQYWFYIADTQSRARRDEEVPKVYDQVIQKFGVDDGILGRLASWYGSRGRWDEARATYAKYEDKIAGQSQIASTYRSEQKYAQAIAVYNGLAGSDPENAANWLSQAAQTHRDAKQWKQAIAVYQGLVKNDAERATDWLWQIAETYYQANMWKEAIAAYRQTDKFPENYQKMAAANRQLKQYKEAILLYQQIMGGEPNQAPWALFQISHTLEDAEQAEAAKKSFMQVCKRFPKTSYASQAHAHLQNKYKINVTLGGATDAEE